MGEKTGITWCESTWNPWWGCVKISPGCTNCYADTLSTRYGYDIWGPNSKRRFFPDKHWNEPLSWYRKAQERGIPTKVFCGSMCDWAEDREDLAVPRARLFDLIDSTSPWLTWLLLTKRPENILKFIPRSWAAAPRHNVWYGTSVENQKEADDRIPHLLQVPARVRFLSAEPLLGPVDLSNWLYRQNVLIRWVITGGESGPHARPMDEQWVRDIRWQCSAAGVSFFHKQMGTVWAKEHGLGTHSHASDPTQWPEDLRIQDFPK